MVAALRVHWLAGLGDIPPAAWDDLLTGVPGGTPFLRHHLLSAMHDSGSASPATGWTPRFLTLWGPPDGLGAQAGAGGGPEPGLRLWAACPVYLKAHSHGEYVFDWAWADAHDRALARQGLRYHPKLLSAVPFSPIPGQRLLVHPALGAPQAEAARRLMLRQLQAACEAQGWSSAHVLFLSDQEAALAASEGWLVREGVQFHWARQPGWHDFADFLASLTRDRRKKIQQERRKVADAGVHFEVREGRFIRPQDWAFFERCYVQTYREHGQSPYLNPAFWQTLAQASQSGADDWVMFTAMKDGQPIAASLLAIDRAQGLAYGRYWGAIEHVSCMHFEACYHQPIAWCIAQGFVRFEGGAQGEHKLHRGLLPVSTHSAHWLQHEGLRAAVADFLARETPGVHRYIDELGEHCPFKPEDGTGVKGETLRY